MTTERTERREEIKLRLEYAKLATSLLGIVVIWIALQQWEASQRQEREAQRLEDQKAYNLIATNWNEHLRMFVERPFLRPYFFQGEPIDPNHNNYNAVSAIAEVRIDLMDSILTHAAARRWSDREVAGWHETFRDAFRASPIMCAHYKETVSHFGLIAKDARIGCATPNKRSTTPGQRKRLRF